MLQSCFEFPVDAAKDAYGEWVAAFTVDEFWVLLFGQHPAANGGADDQRHRCGRVSCSVAWSVPEPERIDVAPPRRPSGERVR